MILNPACIKSHHRTKSAELRESSIKKPFNPNIWRSNEDLKAANWGTPRVPTASVVPQYVDWRKQVSDCDGYQRRSIYLVVSCSIHLLRGGLGGTWSF